MNTFLRSVSFSGFIHKRIALAFAFMIMMGESWGQTIIAQQDFESTPATPVWAISAGSGNISTATGSGDVPSLQRIRNGSRSWLVNNATATLDLSAVTTTSYNSVQVIVYISSTSATSGNGADGTDNVRVFANVNGAGFPGTADITVSGNTNSRWGYNTTGVTTTSGTPVSVSGTPGTNLGTIYSRLIVNIPDGSNSVALRVIALNNDANEFWNVDDIQIVGICTSPPSDPTGTITLTPVANPACISTTLSYSGASANIYWQTSATGTSNANPTTTDLTVTTSGTYYVRAFNGTCWSTNSLASTSIVINTPVSITTQPSNSTVISPATATFTVAATGTISSYQWQVNDGSGWVNASGAPYSGETSATLAINPSTTVLDGNAYRCVINGSSPCTNVTSNSAILTINDGPCVSDVSGYLGWTLSGAISSPNQTCSVNGLLFTGSGQFAVTPSVTNPLLLTFNKKRSGNTTAWSMDIQIGTSSTGPWTTIASTNSITSTCSANPSIDLSAYAGVRYIRFIDTRGTGTNERGIDDISITCGTSCIPSHTITGFTPASGSVGTIVTITGTGFTGATAVKFGSVSVTPTFIDNNTITADVPANALSSKISVTVSGCDVVSASNFNFLSQNANCGTGTFGTNGLIISEVFDSQVGTLSYIELFNPTNAAISLSSYSLRVVTDGPTITDYSLGSASISSGSVYVISIGDDTYPGSSVCGVTVNLAFPAGSGFNGNDQIILRRSGADLDVVNNSNYGSANNNLFKGFSQLRNQGVLNPTTSYNSSEWNNSSTESCSHLGTAPSSLSSSNINISSQSGNVDCAALTFSVTATATPGVINYVWYYHSPGAANWLLVSSLDGTNGLTVTGSGTSSISITGNTSILKDYQFHCKVGSGGSPECEKYTNTVQYTYNSLPVYRSKASGNWTSIATWEMANTPSGPWTTLVCNYPVAVNSSQVIIQNGTTVTMNIDIDVDLLTVENGGTLQTDAGSNAQLTVLNSNVGVDFIVNGTFIDNSNSSNSLQLPSPASWQLGSSATFIKTNNSSSSVYRDRYETGMVNIPASANWIIRYLGTDVSFTTTAGTYYPNLTFESNSGLWNPVSTSTSRFSGNTNFATVKGNFDIGGTGTGSVTVYNENNFASSPMLILGNLLVRGGNTLTNAGNSTTPQSGTGFEVKGNVTVNGTLTVNGTTGSSGVLTLSGTAAQAILGSGTFNLYSLTVNNTAAIGGGSGVTFNRALSMDGLLTLTNGLINTTSTNILTLNATATCPAGGTDVAFVNGPMRKTGTNAFNFPIGKLVGSTGFYGMIGISAPATTTTFEALFYRGNANLLGPSESPLLRVSYCEYWDLVRVAGSENVIVTLSWTPKSRCNVSYINNTAGIVVANLDQTGTAIWKSLGVNALTGDPVNGTITASALPFTYPKFALGSTNISQAPLPLELNSFNAKPKQTAIQLDWSVGNNHQQQKYILERSGNAQVFETIATINAKPGLTAADYLFDDTKPLSGWNYYRLSAKDYQNKTHASQIIKVWMGKGAFISVLPNPASEKIVINLSEPSSILQIQIVNTTGQVLWQLNTIQFLNEINISNLQAGMYYIRFLGKDGVTTKSFIKH